MQTRRAGLTMIELLMVAVVVMVVSIGVFTLLNRVWYNYDALMSENLVQRQAQFGTDLICDELRTIQPWEYGNVYATGTGSNLRVGQNLETDQQFRIYLDLSKQQLVRTANVNALPDPLHSTFVNNITSYDVLCERRTTALADGKLHYSLGPFVPMNDARIKSIAALRVQVTATYRSPLTGLTYKRTLTSWVKPRNQIYDIAPPAL